VPFPSLSERRLSGEDATYPHGTYGPRVFYAAPVEPHPAPGALLALAGPSSLEQALGDDGIAAVEHRNAVLDAVREAQREEVVDLLDEEHLDFEPVAPSYRLVPAAAQREDGETRHRFARTRDVTDTDQHARRLVIERDRRQGRPPGDTGPPR
jgi:hypothetical protein